MAGMTVKPDCKYLKRSERGVWWVDIGCFTFAGHGANGRSQGGQGLMLKLIDPLKWLQFRFTSASPIKTFDDIKLFDVKGIDFKLPNIGPGGII